MINRPDNFVAAFDIALTVQTECSEERSTMSTSNIHKSVLCDRRSTRTFRLPCTAPKLFSGFQIVATSTRLTIHNDLLLAFEFDNQWRRPASWLITIGLPQCLPGELIKGEDGRWSLMVPRHDDLVARERWRTSFSEAVASIHQTEIIPLPDEITFHRIAVETS